MSNDNAQNTPDHRPAVGGPVERIVRPGAAWDERRCKELEAMQELLHEVAAINKGSNCLGRIEKCIALAESLIRFGGDNPSFKHFLRELALTDRFGPRA